MRTGILSSDHGTESEPQQRYRSIAGYRMTREHELLLSEFETVLFCSECVRRPVEDEALRNLRLENLRKAVKDLGEQSRELIDLRYGRELTMEEIGKVYGISKAAVSKRLKTLHEKLRSSVT